MTNYDNLRFNCLLTRIIQKKKKEEEKEERFDRIEETARIDKAQMIHCKEKADRGFHDRHVDAFSLVR